MESLGDSSDNAPLDSVFGIWIDAQKSIRVRIAPNGNLIRIRIMDVLDPRIIEVLSFFCGHSQIPRRTKWKNYDLVTNLVRNKDTMALVQGRVQLPNAVMTNSASLIMLSDSHIRLNFFTHPDSRTELDTGSIFFVKEAHKYAVKVEKPAFKHPSEVRR